MLDRYGKCPNPNCNCEWNKGDILENLRVLEALRDKSETELVNLAYQCYGYSKEHPKSFSRVIAVSVIGDRDAEYSLEDTPVPPDFYMCPKCREVWDVDTHKQFPTLELAKRARYEPNNNQLLNSSQEQTA